MTLIPENQRIVDEQGLISWGQYPERFALAIQTATAEKCVEIAKDSFDTGGFPDVSIREEFGLEKP